MRPTLLVTLLLISSGCASSKGPASVEVQRRDIIDVGQSWVDAKAVATRAKYSVRDEDPIGVEWLPQPAGFVLELDRNFELYVLRDKASETVERLCLVSHARKAKMWRAYLNFESFLLPPAPTGGG